MARVERDMLIVDCRHCGGLHEVVGNHYREGVAMGPSYLCRSEIRALVDRYDSGRTRRVSLGLVPLAGNDQGKV